MEAQRGPTILSPGRAGACARGDAFKQMKVLIDEGARFDVVVMDPPAFIKRRKDIAQGGPKPTTRVAGHPGDRYLSAVFARVIPGL